MKHIIFFLSGNLNDNSRNTFNSLCKNTNDIDWIYIDWQSEININPCLGLNTQSQFSQNMLMMSLNLNTDPKIPEIIQGIIVSECLNAIEKYDNIMVSFMGDCHGSIILYNLLDQTSKDFVLGDTNFPNISRGIFIFIGSNLSMNLILKDKDKFQTNRTIPILHILDPNDPFAYLLEPYFSNTNKNDIMVIPYSSKSWGITKMFWHFMLGFVYMNPSYWFNKFNQRYLKLDTVIDKMKSTPHVVDVQIQPQTLHPFKQVIGHYSQYLSNPDVRVLITDVLKKYFNK